MSHAGRHRDCCSPTHHHFECSEGHHAHHPDAPVGVDAGRWRRTPPPAAEPPDRGGSSAQAVLPDLRRGNAAGPHPAPGRPAHSPGPSGRGRERSPRALLCAPWRENWPATAWWCSRGTRGRPRSRLSGNVPLAIFPSDHYVSDDAPFVGAVARAVEVARRRPDMVVLMGVEAAAPQTEYGWIEPQGRSVERLGPSAAGAGHGAKQRMAPGVARARGDGVGGLSPRRQSQRWD